MTITYMLSERRTKMVNVCNILKNELHIMQQCREHDDRWSHVVTGHGIKSSVSSVCVVVNVGNTTTVDCTTTTVSDVAAWILVETISIAPVVFSSAAELPVQMMGWPLRSCPAVLHQLSAPSLHRQPKCKRMSKIIITSNIFSQQWTHL